MTTRGQVWKCNICGNVVEVLHEGADALVCCGEPMNLMDVKEMEEGTEKHKPVIDVDEDGIVVRVGSVSHPMDEDHYIEWVEISTEKGTAKKFLKPGDAPVAKFPVKVDISKVSARTYCNVHGLWKN
jgi:superoxide reductase